jgi:hypothetical protein
MIFFWKTWNENVMNITTILSTSMRNKINLQTGLKNWKILLANEQKHWAEVRAQKDATRYCPSKSKPDISGSSIYRKAISMVQSMAIVLASCPQVCTHQAILEQVLGHELVVPSLSEYYPHPNEAKLGCDQVTTRFYTFLQAELGRVRASEKSNNQKPLW